MVTSARVAVVGGSLGGLTAALLLRDLGLDVTVYERSAIELEQFGAGIGFLPDSSRYLVERCGLELDSVSTKTSAIRYLRRDGSVDFEREHTYYFSSWNDVYRHLLDAFGRERYLLGHEAIGRTENPDSVTVAFSNGTEQEVDLLVCADGITSRFRSELVPTMKREYAGYVAWRGMVPESAIDQEVAAQLGDALTYGIFANSHILIYPIPALDGSVEVGKRLLNVVWYRNYAPGPDVEDLMTDIHGERREVSMHPGSVRDVHVEEMRATARARLAPSLAHVVCAVEQPFIQAVFDITIDRMAAGRTCIIGDAGFAARPHAAAGTAKAAANGWALAEALEAADEIPEALAAWEPGQVELGRQLVERTQRLGRRSQVEQSWDPRDDETLFRLRPEGP